MRRLLGIWIAALVLAGTLLAPAARAENEGQADLDKATQLKMGANTLGELTEVIRLTESALQKGLAKDSRAYAQGLLASSLIQRGTSTAAAITGPNGPDEHWQEYRKLALADLEKGITLDPKQPQALLLIAKLNLSLPGGDAKRGRQSLDEAIKLGADEPPLQAEALTLRAGIRKDVKERLADLDEAVRVMPTYAAAFRSRGAIRGAAGQLAPALEDFNRVVELEPKNPAGYEGKALVLVKMKKNDEALAALDKAIALSHDTVPLLVEKARIYGFQGNMKAALAELDKANAAAPNSLGVLMLRANVLQELGEKQKAVADVDNALAKLRQQGPADEEALLMVATLYQTLKEYDKAIDIYSDILREHPDHWKCLRDRGDALLSVGKRAEAVADLDRAVAKQPKDPTTLNNLAWLLATAPEDKLRDGRRAVTLATEACRLTDYQADFILSTLAAACAEAGDFPNAQKWSSKALEVGEKSHSEYVDSLKKELASYQAGKPWRESLPNAEEKTKPKKEDQKK